MDRVFAAACAGRGHAARYPGDGVHDGDVVAAIVDRSWWSAPGRLPPLVGGTPVALCCELPPDRDPIATAHGHGVQLVVPEDIDADQADAVVEHLLAGPGRPGSVVPPDRYSWTMLHRLERTWGAKLARFARLAAGDGAQREALAREAADLAITTRALGLDAIAACCRTYARRRDRTAAAAHLLLRRLQLAIQGVDPVIPEEERRDPETASAHRTRVEGGRDVLTGLPDRHAACRALARALREHDVLALVLIRLEGMRSVNRQLGLDVGDELLRRAAAVVAVEGGGVERCGRWSGTTLAMILPGAGGGEAQDRADALVDALEDEVGGLSDALRVRAGIACTPLHAETLDGVVAAAEGALESCRGGEHRLAAPGALQRHRVLVVCADEAFATFLLHALRARGLLASGLEDAAALRARLADEERPAPDLVVLDRELPDADGLELLGDLADHASGAIPAVILADRGAEDDVVAGLESGAVDYLIKPLSVPILLARIVATLED